MKSEINGVILTQLKHVHDDRGWLCETYRIDEDRFLNMMSYVSHTNQNIVRGPHQHISQQDCFVFIGYGDFELHLWDNRKESETFGKHEVYTLGQSNPAKVIVPAGVVHGYKCISSGGGFSINYPNKLYKGDFKQEIVDEIRYENTNLFVIE